MPAASPLRCLDVSAPVGTLRSWMNRLAASGRPSISPATSPTTTKSGACPSTTTCTCSRCSRSRAHRQGLSWSTILNKREGYRRAFGGFDPSKVARYSPSKVERLLADPSIVRNRLKVESTVVNARAVLDVQDELGSLDALLWSFVDGVPLVNRWQGLGDIPAETDTSRAMSKDLKRRGFRFVGPTVCYAFMQACGLVNDHVVTCFRHPEV